MPRKPQTPAMPDLLYGDFQSSYSLFATRSDCDGLKEAATDSLNIAASEFS